MKKLIVVVMSVFLVAACFMMGSSAQNSPQTTKKLWPDATGLRGVNTVLKFPLPEEGYYNDEFFSKLKGWGVNSVRVMLSHDSDSVWGTVKETMPEIPADNPLAPYRKNLQELDNAVKMGTKYGIFIMPCIASTVERAYGQNLINPDGSGYHKTLEKLWEYIAGKYKNAYYVLGYDLLNETSKPADIGAWWDYAPDLIRFIRTIDTETYMCVQSPDQGIPARFRNLQPLDVDDDKIVYVPHPYVPHAYTHSGVSTFPRMEDASYPGYCTGDGTTYVDKAWLKNAMKDVRDFQLNYNARIWANEFSVVRWAEGTGQWTRDMLSIFEEWGWDWAWHSYGEWNGWNPTFDADDPVSNLWDGGKMTERLEALIEYWDLNNYRRLGYAVAAALSPSLGNALLYGAKPGETAQEAVGVSPAENKAETTAPGAAAANNANIRAPKTAGGAAGALYEPEPRGDAAAGIAAGIAAALLAGAGVIVFAARRRKRIKGRETHTA